jgi:hypothetical protein
MIIEGSLSSSGQKNTPGFIELHELRWMGPTLRWRKALIPRELPNLHSSVFNFSLNDRGGAKSSAVSMPHCQRGPIGRRRSKPIAESSATECTKECEVVSVLVFTMTERVLSSYETLAEDLGSRSSAVTQIGSCRGHVTLTLLGSRYVPCHRTAT